LVYLFFKVEIGNLETHFPSILLYSFLLKPKSYL
jgi:hypothetical protein